jgi:hypothetical protein
MLMRSGLLRILIAITVCTAATQLQAQQPLFPVDFSADQFVYEPAHPEQVLNIGKVYVGKGRMRQEMRPPRGPQVVYLIDPTGGHFWELMPENKTVVDMGEMFRKMGGMMGASQQSMATLKPTDPSHPCADSKNVTCQKVGAETINGRSTQKWEFTSAVFGKQSKSYQWIDPQLYIAVKHADDHSVRELRNIQEGPQPDSLFEIPADYRKVTSPGTQ